MILTSLDRFRDAGLLLLRIGLGSLFIVYHGGRKLLAGPDRWEEVGGAMRYFGIDFLPVMWGFFAGAAEVVGGTLVLLGFMFRPGVFLILLVMIAAATSEFYNPDGTPMWPVQIGIVMVSLFLIGPGRFSVDERFKRGYVSGLGY